MAPSLFSALMMSGSGYAAYQAYQDEDQQKMVVFSAVAGVVLSLSLQTLSGRFSAEERSWKKILLGDFTSFLTSVVLPVAVAYVYVKKNSATLHEWSYGIIQIDPQWTLRGLDVTDFFPVLVGANLGFLSGKIIGNVIVHFFKKQPQS